MPTVTEPHPGRGEESSERQLRRLVTEIEVTYRDCWAILADVKSGRPDSRLLELQPLLCGALLKLSRAHVQIAQDRKRLIRRKGALSPKWFAARQRALSRYQDVIEHAVGLGKSLGDAFAWFWYQNDRTLLYEHSKHPPQTFISAGIGGLGELEFVRDVRGISGKLVIYHGTTTILRIGDFSLVEPKPMRVVAIGEIKSGELRDNRLTVEVLFVGSRKRLSDPLVLKTTDAPAHEEPDRPGQHLTPGARARYGRQQQLMARVVQSAAQERPEVSVEVLHSYYVQELSRLLKRAKCGVFTFEHFGEGLMVAVYKLSRSSLYARLSGRHPFNPESIPEEMAACAAHLVLPDSAYNCILIGSLHYAASPQPQLQLGTIPLFWWALPEEFAREIIFHEAIVLTLFNPAHLLARLEAEGFVVSRFDPPRHFEVERREGGHVRRIENLNYFLRLVPNALFRESQVIEIIRGALRSSESQDLTPGTRLEMQFSQELLPRTAATEG